MECFWCGNDFDGLTDDHIIPRSLGGTKAFTVQSCGSCQTKLSKAEHEITRKSILAIHALASPARPRHPNRPTSGNLRPSYLLVKHPLGGYGESLLSAGEKMSSLAHFEVKVVPGEPIEARVRGATAAQAQLLLEIYRRALQNKTGPNELVCELAANFDLAPEITADADFWPRIVLLPGNQLMLRARDREELLRFAEAFTTIALSNYQVDPSRWNNPVQIMGGTAHGIALRYDPQCVRRVAAKIGLGLFCAVTKRRMEGTDEKRMRRYILGVETPIDEPVSITPNSGPITTSEDPHFVVLSPAHDKTAAIVSLYGSDFRIELGSAAVLAEPVIVTCEIDGSGMRICSAAEFPGLAARMEKAAFSQPWRQEQIGEETPSV